MDEQLQDMCRVCRSEATPDRPLFHPCICTGSIKYIHQECLVQWLRYSRKEYCELCNHRFSFTPIYDPDMPKRLPLKDIVSGLVSSVVMAVRCWFHYTLVGLAWLGIVPLFAYRIYRSLFTGSVSSIFTLPLDLLTTENLFADILQGCIVVTCTLCAFISLVWLREQILHGGGPDWLENENGANGENGVDGLGDDQADDIVPVDEGEAAIAPPAHPAPAPEENNWNPIEWDRAAEELTWERLLGLDGSLMFLEHVVWVVSLNTLFILVFAFCPYHIGHFTIAGFGFRDGVTATRFEGLVTTLSGYCVIAAALVCMHAIATLWGSRAQKWQRMLGLCYVVVKVSLLAVVEVGLFPLLCGWWLDLCSLYLFHATLKDREESFISAPGTSMFLHWLAGMVYVFYFANFILLLREVLRPGVLWFLRNLNDPDFNPIQEMIHLSLWRHLRRFVVSLVIFGSTVLLMLWVPVQFIRKVWPSFLPYTLVLTSEVPASELSMELLLLQVVLPALLEQGHMREWLKTLIRGWCVGVSSMLSLQSYLLPESDVEARANGGGEAGEGGNAEGEGEDDEEEEDDDDDEEDDDDDEEEEDDAQQQVVWGAPGGLGAAHQALLQQREGSTEFQPYRRPAAFPLRLCILLVVMSMTVSFGSFLAITIPVWVGRWLLGLWLVGGEGNGRLHELYTGSCGLYVCWLVVRAITLVFASLPQGWNTLIRKVKHWAVLAGKLLVAVVLLTGVVPLLFGLLLELVVVIPLRVPLTQSPLHFLWQDWALGVLYTKITCALTMMGPNWWLKQAIEQVYQDGMRNLRMKGVVWDLAVPVITALGLAVTVPYVIAYSLTPLFVPSKETQLLICRRIYPSLLLVVIIVGLLGFQIVQFTRLYEHIKNDKYLVGRRLVNYNHRDSRDTQSRSSSPSSSPSVSS